MSKAGKYIAFILSIVILTGVFSVSNDPNNVQAAVDRVWSVKMADSVIERDGSISWRYEHGLVLQSLVDLGIETVDQKYYNYVKAKYDSMIGSDGSISGYSKAGYRLDDINPGKTLFELYRVSGDKKYKLAMDKLRGQIDSQPRNGDGGFWHKQIYPNQMWLDGIYMAGPFYAKYDIKYGNSSNLSDVTKQIKLIAEHTYEPSTGLYLHAWDYSKEAAWADPQTGASPVIWGRAMGWYLFAIVDILDLLPENHPDRADILAIYKTMVKGIIKYQDSSTGLWYQVVDKPLASGNWLEASSSCMYVYGIMKGVRKGYIDTSYVTYAQKAYNGIISKFINVDSSGNANLTGTCEGTSVGSNNNYYFGRSKITNDFKGVGPFIYASIEIENYAENPIATPVKTFTNTPAVTVAVTPVPTNENYIIGDVDGNGTFNSIDFAFLRQYLLGIISKFSGTNGNLAADIDKNGSINSLDFAMMRQILLGAKIERG